VVVAPETATLAVGEARLLTARVLDARGADLEGQTVVWSSDDDAVARVEGNGTVHAVGVGTATITAASAGREGTARIAVVPPPVASVTVDPDTATLPVGGTRRLTAVLRSGTGAELAGRSVAWTTSNEAVASVAADGVVRAHAAGSVRITAESEGVTGIAEVLVVPVPALRLELVASGLPTTLSHLTSPPGDNRLVVTGLNGQIRVIENGRVLPELFLDLSERVAMAGELGLFSLAFHPRFASNRYFFVTFTDRQGIIRVERYTVGADPNRADPASAKVILAIEITGWCHFTGMLEFGPDGKLYIGVGDGCNPANSQDKGNLFGKLLRIDVDAGDPYAIPADNPFVGQPGVRAEIWALGLRNPWRWSIDRETGLLFIGDVGGNDWEEINVAPLGRGGLNFGWPIMEGAMCHPLTVVTCARTGLTLPVLAYPHVDRGTGHPTGCSVTGGHVYRGSRMPGLRGHYFYGDFCRGWVRSFRYENGNAVDQREWAFGRQTRLVSFGVDAAGEIFILSGGGNVHRIVP
jgi:glucose/arabinose dehydrogenase